MNIQQTTLLIEKISGLHKSIFLDGEISSIERDLMMSYIRQLYESYMDAESTPVAKPRKTTKVKPVQVSRPDPAEKIVAIKPTPQPEPVVVPAPKAPAPVIAAAPQPEPVSIPAATPAAAKGSPAVEALFRHQAATELSEKLSQQNIADLTKALSINDKLLYSNELFDRDMASMNTTLQQLNKLSGMEEAKGVLVAVADKNNWGDSERSEVAESFIKMVRRRY